MLTPSAPAAKHVHWTHLKPDAFRARQTACPVIFLPFGLCEPHGHPAALGLDLLKAEYYCTETARRFGGIVAPSQGYHIHETGFHARWLEEVVGEENAMLAALPPQIVAHNFLYQLRAFARAGFRAVLALSGHGGGSQEDLRRVAAAFENHTGLRVFAGTDAELVSEKYCGDHAGKFEFSQLMAIDPSLVDLSLVSRQHEPGSGGRLALGTDASEASIALGNEVNEAIITALGKRSTELLLAAPEAAPLSPKLSFQETEKLWSHISSQGHWKSSLPKPNQHRVSENSRWKSGENF